MTNETRNTLTSLDQGLEFLVSISKLGAPKIQIKRRLATLIELYTEPLKALPYSIEFQDQQARNNLLRRPTFRLLNDLCDYAEIEYRQLAPLLSSVGHLYLRDRKPNEIKQCSRELNIRLRMPLNDIVEILMRTYDERVPFDPQW